MRSCITNQITNTKTDLNRFIVIGYYPDNDQVYASAFKADTWQEAVESCRADIDATLRITAVLNADGSVADDYEFTEEVSPIGDI